MPYAITSKAHGTYVGAAMGLIFFTNHGDGELDGDTCAGQYVAYTAETEQEAQEIIDDLVFSVIGEDGQGFYKATDLSFVEVKSGHWKDLEAAGLHLGTLADNELLHMPTIGYC